MLVLWCNKYVDSNRYLLIQQIQTKSYILKLKHQKLHKHKLTGKDCCTVVKDTQHTGGRVRSFDNPCWWGMDVMKFAEDVWERHEQPFADVLQITCS